MILFWKKSTWVWEIYDFLNETYYCSQPIAYLDICFNWKRDDAIFNFQHTSNMRRESIFEEEHISLGNPRFPECDLWFLYYTIYRCLFSTAKNVKEVIRRVVFNTLVTWGVIPYWRKSTLGLEIYDFLNGDTMIKPHRF